MRPGHGEAGGMSGLSERKAVQAMCEYGTDKATCPNCPETCQGRDYQKDLDIKPEDMASGWEYDEEKGVYRVEYWSGEVREFKYVGTGPENRVRVFPLKAYAKALESQLQQTQKREKQALAVVDAAREYAKYWFALAGRYVGSPYGKQLNALFRSVATYDKAGDPQPIKQLCEDQRGDKCTVREALCGITGENTCCLTCGKAKNCEDPCEYVDKESVND